MVKIQPRERYDSYTVTMCYIWRTRRRRIDDDADTAAAREPLLRTYDRIEWKIANKKTHSDCVKFYTIRRNKNLRVMRIFADRRSEG